MQESSPDTYTRSEIISNNKKTLQHNNWPWNKTFQQKNKSGITSRNKEELESVNVTRTCNSKANEIEKTFSTYDNKGNKKTPGTFEKEENVNERQKETVKACEGYISTSECRKYLSLNVWARAYQQILSGEYP